MLNKIGLYKNITASFDLVPSLEPQALVRDDQRLQGISDGYGRAACRNHSDSDDALVQGGHPFSGEAAIVTSEVSGSHSSRHEIFWRRQTPDIDSHSKYYSSVKFDFKKIRVKLVKWLRRYYFHILTFNFYNGIFRRITKFRLHHRILIFFRTRNFQGSLKHTKLFSRL